MSLNAEQVHEQYRSQEDAGLVGLCGIAAYYRIPAEPALVARELALSNSASPEDIIRAARVLRMRARIVRMNKPERILSAPTPALVQLRGGNFVVYGGRTHEGTFRMVDPVRRIEINMRFEELAERIEPFIILVGRQIGGPGTTPQAFSLKWFLTPILRYRWPLAHVLLATLVLQIFALITPLFFQIIVDKVLSHQGYETLYVLIAGLAAVSIFEALLQYMRTYALSHTSNRIDVELGRRLFHHLLALPLSYFESVAAGQTVARVRELENIRAFLTGQAMFSAIDLVFTIIMIAVLFFYSAFLTILLLLTIPLYIVIAAIIRPVLRDKIKEKFNKGAESQQYLVEAVIGIHTIKAAAVEPIVRSQWEEKLASYVRTSFSANMLSAGGQNMIQLVSKAGTVLFLFFGAEAVMNGDMTVGQLIAFNMIAAQVIQPVLRLSQLWQDFQQVQVSIDRLGDILNRPVEVTPSAATVLDRPRGLIDFQNVHFRYRLNGPEVIQGISLRIMPGQVIGIIGPSGSGKSTLSKLIQRLYVATEGNIMLDGMDVNHVDIAWLRSNIGVVLQENLLFNRSVHDNIAFARPGASRRAVIEAARLAGADDFIQKLPYGYDTVIEERGANLSGGQRQRIAIARALITDPPILIFDEATSALDYDSERIIRNNMTAIVKNRTVIIIAHRLSTVRHCDKIIGMENGNIVEAGTHDELLASKGLYHRLWRLQSEEN